MALTVVQVKAAKPKEKPYKMADERGLYLLINPNGSKLWKLKYRFAKREKKLSLGAFPTVSLAAAMMQQDFLLLLNRIGSTAKKSKPHVLYGIQRR